MFRHRPGVPLSSRTPDAKGAAGVVWVLVVLGVVGAGFAPCRPTGVVVFDVCERAVLGGVFVWFTARSRRWTRFVVAGGALVFAGTLWGAAVALVALALVVGADRLPRRHERLLGALVGLLGGQVLLRAAAIGRFGFTALVTAVVVAVVVVSGYRAAPEMSRRRIRRISGALVAVTLVAVAGFGFTIWRSQAPMNEALAHSQGGMAKAEAGSQYLAALHFLAAESAFERAHELQRSPAGRLAAAVPILSQHARLVTTASRSGGELAENAFRAVAAAPYGDLRADDGTVDLGRLEAMRVRLSATIASTRRTLARIDAASSPWLVGPVRHRIVDYRAELTDSLPKAEQAVRALDVVPSLLGARGPKRYLVLFANPAESRGLGGFIGAWAELEADNGHVRLTRHGHIDDLNDATDWETRTITAPSDYLARYSRLQPQRFIQNVSASPDFPTVARVSTELYRQTMHTRVDGVLYVDPIALGALLELTGPVLPEGSWYRIHAKNAADYLMHDQYLRYPGRTERRIDVLSETAEATFEALTHGELPPIRRVTEVLSPMIRQGRLLFWAADAETDSYFTSMGMTGAFPRPDGHDLLSVRISNASTNKADYFIDQTTRYTVRYDPRTGATRATARVTFVNHAPSSGEPSYVLGNQDTRTGKTDGRPFGSDTLAVSVYSALRPTALAIDGVESGVEVQRELGAWVGSQSITVGPGGRVTVRIDLTGTLRPGDRYHLTVAPQPSARPRHTTVVVEPTDASGEVVPDLVTTRTLDDDEVEHLSVAATVSRTR